MPERLGNVKGSLLLISWDPEGEIMAKAKKSGIPDNSRHQEKMILYEYALVRHGALEDSFSEWYRGLPSKVKGWVFQRLSTMQEYTAGEFMLFAHGPIKEHGVKYPHIYKLKFGGKIEYRPLLCIGPVLPVQPHVITLLLGAKEVQGRITPSPQGAVDRREAIVADPLLQRLLQIYDERTKQWLRSN